jgi:seryl-tRNA synthetase
VKLALEGDSADKGEKIEILVPRSNSDVKEILQEYEEDKEKLEDMPSVEELEEEINELVYGLYDLDDEEIKVIEDFLEKF